MPAQSSPPQFARDLSVVEPPPYRMPPVDVGATVLVMGSGDRSGPDAPASPATVLKIGVESLTVRTCDYNTQVLERVLHESDPKRYRPRAGEPIYVWRYSPEQTRLMDLERRLSALEKALK